MIQFDPDPTVATSGHIEGPNLRIFAVFSTICSIAAGRGRVLSPTLLRFCLNARFGRGPIDRPLSGTPGIVARGDDSRSILGVIKSFPTCSPLRKASRH